MKAEILKKLQQLTPVEAEQKTTKHFVADFAGHAFKENDLSLTMPVFSPTLFNNQEIFVSKHARFADCPEHTHLFLEANYLLSGQATETVAGKDLTLKAGDLLLLDVGTPHAIQALGKDDLLINLIFSETADFSFAQLIPGRKAEYLVFRHDQAEAEIQTMADLLIAEFWSKNPSKNLLHHYLGALKVLLLRDAAASAKASQQSPIVSQMLKEISGNFKTTSLKKFAEENSYNSSYLGSLFKKEVGLSFSQAQTEERLLIAAKLLKTSNLPVSEIAKEVGISNKTFFYQKFAEKYGCSPKEMREENKH